MLGGLCLVHAIAFLIVPSVRKDFSKTPHLAAHFVATLVGFLAFAAQGTSLWLATPYLNNEPCVTDHIAGQCAEGARLAHAMMAFQTYEVIGRIAIRHEEAYLERKFGAAYTDYKARVRRWL